jgi:hypothetical protein
MEQSEMIERRNPDASETVRDHHLTVQENIRVIPAAKLGPLDPSFI